MRLPPTSSHWSRHFVYRTERTRTTWKLRIGLLALVVVTAWLTSGWWTVTVARGLVCDAGLAPSDAILVENFDRDYMLFKRAGQLRRSGLAPRVLVPTPTGPDTREPDDVDLETVQVMAKAARIGTVEIVPTRVVEPITLNSAREVLRFLQREHIHSVIVVTPLFRSRRSDLVYRAVLGPAGITVRCEPVQGGWGVSTWTRTWHGIQDVLEQWLKFQYYRIAVLPWNHATAVAR